MEVIAEILNSKLRVWKPEISDRVRALAEIIVLADEDVLDLGRSRAVDQEVLDLLDGSPPR